MVSLFVHARLPRSLARVMRGHWPASVVVTVVTEHEETNDDPQRSNIVVRLLWSRVAEGWLGIGRGPVPRPSRHPACWLCDQEKSQPNEGEIFFHVNNLEGLWKPQDGMYVGYEVDTSPRNGKPEAR